MGDSKAPDRYMSDSTNLRLIVECLLTISKVTLCPRFSFGFRSGDWAIYSSHVLQCCSDSSSCWPFWCDGMAHCQPKRRLQTRVGDCVEPV